MPYIYFRVDTVLVWLGKKYAKYESADAKEDVETGPEPARKNTPDEAIGPPNSSTVDADCSSTPTGDRHTGGEAAFAEEANRPIIVTSLCSHCNQLKPHTRQTNNLSLSPYCCLFESSSRSLHPVIPAVYLKLKGKISIEHGER